jgi:NADH:ubiquinone oxidoreductase subunit E
MKTRIKKIIDKYDGDKGFLVPILQDVQREYNYLNREALHLVSSFLKVPISQLYEVGTFYKAFSLDPRGRHEMKLCTGTACHVRGVSLIKENIERILQIKAGETTPDLEFTFETVNCLGACALGPILVVDGEYHGKINISKTNKILKKLGKKVKIDEEN